MTAYWVLVFLTAPYPTLHNQEKGEKIDQMKQYKAVDSLFLKWDPLNYYLNICVKTSKGSCVWQGVWDSFETQW